MRASSLCCQLQRRLHDLDAISAAADSVIVALDALEPDLCDIAQRERGRAATVDVVPAPAWTCKQKSALAGILTRCRTDAAMFADVLVSIGIDDDLAHDFAHDLMANMDPTPVINAVRNLDPDSARSLVWAVVGRVPVRHLDDIVDDVVSTKFDLFNESDPDSVSFVAAVCDQILTITTSIMIPTIVARQAAAAASLDVIFIDWIGNALKQTPDRLGRRQITGRDAVHLIVIADNLAAIITGHGHQSDLVTNLRQKWCNPLSVFQEHIQYTMSKDHDHEDVAQSDSICNIYTVRASMMSRIAEIIDPSITSLSAVPADPLSYVVLRSTPSIKTDEHDQIGSELIHFLRHSPPLVECPQATFQQQLMTAGASPGVVHRLCNVLQSTVPAELTQHDFHPLLVQLLGRYEQKPTAPITELSRVLEEVRAQVRDRTAAVLESEARVLSRAVIDAIKTRTQRFAVDLIGVSRGGNVCRQYADETGGLVCSSCYDLIRSRSHLLTTFTRNALQTARSCHAGPALDRDDVVHRVRRYIADTATQVVRGPACNALGHVLERLATTYPTLDDFRTGFGGRTRIITVPYDEDDFAEAIAGLSRVRYGDSDDWARICRAHMMISEIVTIGAKTKADMAGDVISTLAYAILKVGACNLGVALTVLGARDDEICRSRTYIHTSVAVNALFTMSTAASSLKSKPSTETIEA